MVRGVQLGGLAGRAVSTQSRLLARRGLVGGRTGGAPSRRRRAVVERQASRPLRGSARGRKTAGGGAGGTHRLRAVSGTGDARTAAGRGVAAGRPGRRRPPGGEASGGGRF